jgi:hypothetical protein
VTGNLLFYSYLMVFPYLLFGMQKPIETYISI